MVDGSTDDLIAGVARHTHFQASSSASNSRETGASWRDERYNSTERRTFGVLQYLRRTARDVDERLIARFIRDEVSPAITS